MQVVVTGSIAYDYIMSFPGKFSDHLLPDQLHNISVSFLVDSMQRLRGGVAPNIAYTNSLLGGKPKIMAAAGKDFEEYQRWLEDQGVDTSGIVIFSEDYCASFFVNTDQDNNQIASFYTGAMSHAKRLCFSENAPDAELAIISPNDPTAMTAYVQECKSLEIPYIYDPSQQIIRLSGSDLLTGITGCYLLTVNEYELSMILEKTRMNHEELLEKAGGLLVTLGDSGSRIYIEDRNIDIPVVAPERIVEPTGAGDAYRGGLLRGIQLGFTWETAGRMGALAAAYVLEQVGTQGHSFSIDDFVTRYRSLFDDEGALDLLIK